jgi:cytokinesis protein
MDDLLAKLKAAKPEARDKRDQRRRARLKDRHQVRIASGQKIPDMAALVKDKDLDIAMPLSPLSDATGASHETEPTDERPENLEDGDVAERAMSLLEGLKNEVGVGSDEEKADEPKLGVPREESLRVRRRREGAATEREQRRQRRRQLALSESSSARGDNAANPIAIPEEPGENSPTKSERRGSDDQDVEMKDSGEDFEKPATPVTIVSPPSPEGESKKRGVLILTPPPGD